MMAASHWIIVPAVLPAMAAAFLILVLRHDLGAQRVVSIGATLILAAVAIGLLVLASSGPPLAYRLGAWPAPFGIVLVLDRLSATMLVLTAVLALAVLVYAVNGWDAKGRHFHPLFQFQLLGINGAFLTGDVFNLFVFFEVMLIASYGLMLHGGGALRLKAGFQYVAVNLFASTLFLIAVGLIYAVTGTLNMADLAVKAALVPADDQAILKAGALLLLMVFATKAAFVPLHWWLPGTYANTSAPVAALFMIMTKVGAYAILRVFGLVFGEGAGAVSLVAAPLVLPAALATLGVGAIGLLGSRSLRALSAFAALASMGTLLTALGLFNQTGTVAALYYLVHSTLAGAALFLIAGMVSQRRGESADALVPAPAVAGETVLAGLFFLAALAMVGLPPLSGFLGKLMVLQAAAPSPLWAAIWAMILGSSLVMTLGFARAGSTLFWASLDRPPAPPGRDERPAGLGLPAACVAFLLALVALWTFAAGPVTRALSETATQSLNREGYVHAVLGPDGRTAVARAVDSQSREGARP